MFDFKSVSFKFLIAVTLITVTIIFAYQLTETEKATAQTVKVSAGNNAAQSTTINTATTSDKAPADLLTANAEVILRLDGSNTIGDKLAPALAAAYIRQLGAEVTINKSMDVNNEMQVIGYLPAEHKTVAIQINAHGSSTGFQAMIKNKTDIAMSSRNIKAKENLELLLKFGDMTNAQSEHVIALDGLAIITHPDNPLAAITVTQLAQIFSGEISNWNQLGGGDMRINLYARDNQSGTYDTFKSLVLDKFNKKLGVASRFESNEELVKAVGVDVSGIGFTGLAYAQPAMIVDVSAATGIPAIEPKQFSISSEDYALSRRLFLYANKIRSENKHVKGLIDFAVSTHGQQLVEQVRFIPQKITSALPVVTGEFPAQYQLMALNGERLSMTFRMRADRAEIDNKSVQDIGHLVDYLKHTPHQKVTLIGFSAGESQDESADRRRAYIRSRLLAYELNQRGIRNVEIIALGNQLPIDSNSSEMGRYRNNRTEIWLTKVAESS